MNRYRSIISLLIAVILPVSEICAEQHKPVVAVIAPLSGQLAFMGDGLRKGMLLNKELTAAYDIVLEDNKGSGPEAVSAYRKLATIQHPALVIAAGAGDEALSPFASADNSPLLFTIASASGLANASKGAFRYFTNADVDAPVIANHAYKARGFRKAAIIHLQDRFSSDYARVFGETFTKQGGRIVAHESFNYGESDFKAQVLRVKGSSPDTIYLIGLDYQLIGLATQIKHLGLSVPLLAIGTIASKDVIQKSDGVFEGVEVTAFCTDGPNPEFVKEFKSAYGMHPDFFSELGSDIAAIVVKAKGKDAPSFTKGLQSLGTMDLNAGKVSQSPSGEIIIPACVKRITGGRIFNLETGKYSEY